MPDNTPWSLDQYPAWVRHLVIVVGTVVLGAVSQAIAAQKFDAATIGAAIVSGLVAQALLWLTALTRQYGVGAPPPAGEPVIEGGNP